LIERRREKMLRLWKRKRNAVKNWRSRAWSIDPRLTNLTIIKTEAKIDCMDLEDSNLDFNLDFPKLLEDYPHYFVALADMEQFS
jgi:hypothetical protein